MDISSTRKTVNQKLIEFNFARKKYREEHNLLTESEEKVEAILKAQEIAQQIAQEVQQQAHDQIAGVVSRCLEAVFEEPYTFKIHFERKRGRTEARLVFEREGLEIDPMSASGGGIIDVAAFALRLSCLSLSQPPLRRLLVLDEPFRFLSEEYRERAKILLETLSEEMEIQILIITHMEELKTENVITLRKGG